MVFISGSRVLGFLGTRVLGFLGSRVLKFSSSCVLGLLGSRALKFWGTLLFFKIKLQQDNNKKIWKKVKKKLDFFFLVTSHGPGYPRIPEISEFRVRAGRVWPISWSGSSGSEFWIPEKSGAGQDIRLFRFFAHVIFNHFFVLQAMMPYYDIIMTVQLFIYFLLF